MRCNLFFIAMKFECLLAAYSVGYLVSRYFLKKLFHLRRMTPKTASPNMLEFILDVPSTRLTKMMGTSTTLKPYLNAVNFISIWNA